MANFDDFKLAIEAMSGGKNTVIFDDMEMPSVMVPIPKFTIGDVITGGSSNVHPAFMVDGVEKAVMYASKFQNIVLNNRAYSLPLKDPKVYTNFDQSVTYCRNKGNGWGLMPFSLWAALALWCRKNGTMPRGNNNYGKDSSYTHEKGVPAAYNSDGTVSRILTGSGPAGWYHNWMPDGIADLNGNIWEWCAGMRLNDGEINIIPYANCMNADASMSATSTLWKAIALDGSMVEPGTSGTLKYSATKNSMVVSNSATTGSQGGSYAAMSNDTGGTIPEIAKALILYPDELNGDYGGDNHYWNVEGERLPICGGCWATTSSAGVFCVDLNGTRSNSHDAIGFRSAFCEL